MLDFFKEFAIGLAKNKKATKVKMSIDTYADFVQFSIRFNVPYDFNFSEEKKIMGLKIVLEKGTGIFKII